MNLKETLLEILEEYSFSTVQNVLLDLSKSTDPMAFMIMSLQGNSLYGIINDASYNRNGWKTEKEPDDYENPARILSHGTFYYKVNGTYSSYGETTWDTWEVVTPKTKTVTYFE